MDQPLFEQEPRASESRWKIMKREVLHKNPWYEYRHDAGLTDQGKPYDYYYVYFSSVSSVVVALTPEQKIVLVRQYRYVAGHDCLQIPGGRSKGLSAHAAAIEELREETGYEPGDIRHIASIDYAPGHSTDQVEIFLATDCRPAHPQQLEDSEAGMKVELYSIADIYDMAERGLINDSLTLACLMLAKRHLPRKG